MPKVPASIHCTEKHKNKTVLINPLAGAQPMEMNDKTNATMLLN